MLTIIIVIVIVCQFASYSAFHSRKYAYSRIVLVRSNNKRDIATGSSRPGNKVRKTSNTPGNNVRQLKAVRVLRDEISDIICSGDIKANVYPDENLLKAVSIINIDLSSDFSIAKITISVAGNSVEKRQIYVWLNDNIGQVRHSLAQRLRNLRKVPQISFELADTQSAFYLNDVMDNFSSNLPSKGIDNFESVDFEEDE
mmetsp:Transcript_14632/g.21806  ORF Transcript_14632/g.21806 Transcript_14632/m.21806 type:complete len:199 (+) Transcript_14632:29-625(+)